MADELSQLETQLLAKLAPLAAQPVIVQPFAGVHDITVAGTQSPQGNPVSIVLTVVAGGATSPNTFTITVDGGTPSAAQNMTTTAASIGNGFTAAFASITGHTAGDTCVIENGPCRVIRAWLCDGSEESLKEAIGENQAVVPIGILSSPTTQEDPFDVKGNAAANISYVATWTFLTFYGNLTSSTELSGDPAAFRRAWYYNVKHQFDLVCDDTPLTSIADPTASFDPIYKFGDSFQNLPGVGVVTRHTFGVKVRFPCRNVIN